MASRLDPLCTGSVDLHHLSVYLVLASCSIPSARQLEALPSKQFLSAQELEQTALWFQDEENEQPEPNRNPFDRARHMRRLVGLQVRTGEFIDRARLVDVLLLRAYAPAKSKTYKEFLFG
jgi:hypothetical protein